MASFTVISLPSVSFDFEPIACETSSEICFTIENNLNRSGIEFSLNGGISYLPTESDQIGSVCYDIALGEHDLYVRWGDNTCPIFLGTVDIIPDNIPPSIRCPQDVILQCDASTGTDNTGLPILLEENCSDLGLASINFDDNATLTSCANTTGSIIRTFTVSDIAGNVSTCEQTLTIIDTRNPEITIFASDITVECDGAGNISQFNAWLASNGGSIATDACSNVTWSAEVLEEGDQCSATSSTTIRFTVVDDCLNTVSTTATFTIADTRGPVITTAPTNLVLDCNLANQQSIIDNLSLIHI